VISWTVLEYPRRRHFHGEAKNGNAYSAAVDLTRSREKNKIVSPRRRDRKEKVLCSRSGLGVLAQNAFAGTGFPGF
jgi:hypothetical protein